MTKRYKTLQKKLQELKAELYLVFSLPAKTPHRQLLSEEIEQRFVFLKKLLSAEIASHPSKPHHLHHIAQRLNELEAAFREWDAHNTTTAFNSYDTASVCSCDESCRNDDGEAYDLPDDLASSAYEVENTCPGGLVDVEVQDDKKKQLESEAADERKRGRVYVFARYCGVFFSGMIFGMVLKGFTMSGFSSCSYSTVQEGFWFPT